MKFPKVGIGVFVMKDGKFLMAKRKVAHGGGSWGLPGGHLEFNESWEDCAIREVMEETGVNIKNIRFVTATNDIFEKEGKHYVTLFILSDYDYGEVSLKEPENFDEWRWVSWREIKNLNKELFVPVANLIKSGFSI